MSADRITEDTIRQLIDGFYRKVRKDAALAPLFENVIGATDADWEPHLRKMYDFWSSVMLTTGRYHGTPFQKHQALPVFDAVLFDRWLELFTESAREMHTADIAARYAEKSALIAKSLKYGLYEMNRTAFPR